MNTYNINELISTFTEMWNTQSELLNNYMKDCHNKDISNSINELTERRKSKLKSIIANFTDYLEDDIYVAIHDIILCDGDFDGIKMPNGYKATIFESYYCATMRITYTYALVDSPTLTQYIICVNTCGYMKIGKVFE